MTAAVWTIESPWVHILPLTLMGSSSEAASTLQNTVDAGTPSRPGEVYSTLKRAVAEFELALLKFVQEKTV